MTTQFYKLTGWNVVNVKHYGAAGDGSTNDRVAIQNAVYAAWGTPPAYNGGVGGPQYDNRSLYFPRGHYKIDAPIMIVMTSGVAIFGDGKLATIIENTSTDTVFNRNPYAGAGVDPHTLYYPQRSVFSADSFQFSTIKGMTLKCNGGICCNVAWGNRTGSIATQDVVFTDMKFDCGGITDTGIGVMCGGEPIPFGGVAAISRTGNLSNGSTTISNLSTTADIDLQELFVLIDQTPYVPGDQGLGFYNKVMAILSSSSVQVQSPATVTEANVPLLFGHYASMSERNRFQNCEFVGCGFAGVTCNNPNALQNCVHGCYFDSCGTAIISHSGSFPTVYGSRFHNSASYDYKFNNSYSSYGDGIIIAGCYSDSQNFGLFHAGPGLNLSGITHDNVIPGNFIFLEGGAVGTACIDACYSRSGNLTGNGKVYGRGNTWGLSRSTAFASFAGTWSDI